MINLQALRKEGFIQERDRLIRGRAEAFADRDRLREENDRLRLEQARDRLHLAHLLENLSCEQAQTANAGCYPHNCPQAEMSRQAYEQQLQTLTDINASLQEKLALLRGKFARYRQEARARHQAQQEARLHAQKQLGRIREILEREAAPKERSEP